MKRVAAWALSVFVSAASASAVFADVNLREVVCFGDSLTDNQSILPWYTGESPRLYGHDPMELVFNKNRQPGNELSNYAVAGFTSDLVDLQIELYEFNNAIWLQRDATLFQLEMGGNDLLGNEDLLTQYAPGENGRADGIINTIIDNFADYTRDLYEDARPDAKAVLWTLPDLTQTPRYWEVFNDQQESNMRAHIEHANAAIRGYARFASVVVLDLWAIVNDWIENPPDINGLTLRLPPFYGESGDFFADDIHPTAVSNGLIANELVELMNLKWDAGFIGLTEDELYDLAINGGDNSPIPAPASLLMLLLGFVLLVRRRHVST